MTRKLEQLDQFLKPVQIDEEELEWSFSRLLTPEDLPTIIIAFFEKVGTELSFIGTTVNQTH